MRWGEPLIIEKVILNRGANYVEYEEGEIVQNINKILENYGKLSKGYKKYDIKEYKEKSVKKDLEEYSGEGLDILIQNLFKNGEMYERFITNVLMKDMSMKAENDFYLLLNGYEGYTIGDDVHIFKIGR